MIHSKQNLIKRHFLDLDEINILSTQYSVILRTLIILIFFFSLLLFAALNSPLFKLNENQILSLSSTSSQIISGVYGLTLTGFIFFVSELDRKNETDESIAEIVCFLKQKFRKFFIFLTIMSGCTLLFSALAASSVNNYHPSFLIIYINLSQSFFYFSLISIFAFILDMINPNITKKASIYLKNEIDPPSGKLNKGGGDFKLFSTNFHSIKENLRIYSNGFNEGLNAKNIFFSIRLIEILYNNQQITQETHDSLLKIISVGNTIVHGADPIVSEEIVSESSKILTQLCQLGKNLTPPIPTPISRLTGRRPLKTGRMRGVWFRISGRRRF